MAITGASIARHDAWAGVVSTPERAIRSAGSTRRGHSSVPCRRHKASSPAGTPGVITQTLGGSYTIATYQGLARVAEKDLDALGLEKPASANGAARLLFVAKHIERIGDYVKDICELNVYLREAVFIKHSERY